MKIEARRPAATGLRDVTEEGILNVEATAMPAPVQSTLGRRIRRARFELGMDQAEFARKIGVTRWTVNNWENEKRRPGPSNLERIARASKRDIGWLIDGIPDDEL